ncbi:hypothetical protein KAJ89_03240 [Candidatus Parcubacteria bacterium]|nr:hypothetical protein [Candidatus Parcubacteria bacterium]
MSKTYNKKVFVARPPKPNMIVLCGCEKQEVVDKASGYFVWKTIKTCEQHAKK